MKKQIALAKVVFIPHAVFHSEKHSPHLTGTKATFSPWKLQSEPYKSNLCLWVKTKVFSTKSESEFPSLVVFPSGRGLEALSIFKSNEQHLLQDWQFLRHSLLLLRFLCLTIILRLQRRMNNGKKSTMLAGSDTNHMGVTNKNNVPPYI